MIQKFKRILKEEGITGKEFADIIGVSYDSFRTMTKEKAKVTPKWVTSFVIAYDIGRGLDDDLICLHCEENPNGFGDEGLFCQSCNEMFNGIK